MVPPSFQLILALAGAAFAEEPTDLDDRYDAAFHASLTEIDACLAGTPEASGTLQLEASGTRIEARLDASTFAPVVAECIAAVYTGQTLQGDADAAGTTWVVPLDWDGAELGVGEHAGSFSTLLGLTPTSRETIDAIIRGDIAAIRACYMAGLVLDRSLEGRLVVRFTIAPDGTVSRAERAKGDLDQPEVIYCILERFERMRFPASGGPVIVSYPFLFSQEASVAARRRPGPHIALTGGAQVTAGDPYALPPALIERVTHRDRERLYECYRRALDADATLSGELVADLEIAKSGRVTAATLQPGGPDDAAFRHCTADAFTRIKYPRPGEPIEVRFRLGYAVR